MRRLRLGLDAGYDSSWPAGLTYVRNLVYALASLTGEEAPYVRLLPIDSKTVRMISDLQDFPHVELATPDWPRQLLDLSLLLRRVSRKLVQPRLQRPIHKAFSGLDVTYPGWGKPIPGTSQMDWIPDLQHVHMPHLFGDRELQQRATRFAAIADREGIVIFSSQAALDDFTREYPDHRASTRVWNFTTTIGDAERGGRDPRIAFDLPEHFLYVANQFWAHKDHLTVFKALLILRDRGLAPTVVCTGTLSDARNLGYVAQVRAFLTENALTDQVRILGLVDRADQVQIFRHAAAIVQPSRFEGWSTVIEDARAIGRPVIASDISVHLEQIADAVFFEAGSAQALADVVARVLPNLPPGPDPVAEREAAAESETRRLKAARDFVRIAEEALTLDERIRSRS